MNAGALPFRWRRFGDLGVLLELEDGARAIAWCHAIERSGLAATARPGWRSVLVTSAVPVGALIEALSVLQPDDRAAAGAREREIPVVYDGDDLGEVAQRTGLEVDEVVELHTAALYTVVCLGFSRAFPYLSGLDPALRLPRRDTPRVKVLAGSVAIASDQTGIYPQHSPGGWHLLGRTTEVLFDERSDPPSRLQPGDRVRFVPIDR
ncbi:MAG: allophanate hydrolase subunit 1 [Acidimicrobiia bacterium]